MTTSTDQPSVTRVLWEFLTSWKTLDEIKTHLNDKNIIISDIPRAIRRMRSAGYNVHTRIIAGSSPRQFQYFAD
jgi:hypothetical protein